MSWRAFALLIALVAALPAHAKRVALVIGNDNYQHVSRLQKAGNDASAMARELQAAGFRVLLHRDLNYRGMVKAVESLGNAVTGGDEVIVFFAGHGVQIRSGSYLLPVDIEASSEAEVEKTSYALNDLMDQLAATKASFSLVMVDACRDNPLRSRGRTIGTTRGLNAPEPPKGQMVVYSAGRGQQALDRLNDRDANANSVFTREFITRMRKPGVRVDEMMREVQDAVENLARTVSHEQRPAIYNEARGSFYFFGPTTVRVENPAPAPVAASPEQREDRFWDDTKSLGNREAFEAYLIAYPDGRYANLARAHVARLARPPASPVTPPAPAAVTAPAVTPNPSFSQARWDLPGAYPASNFHTENLLQFAADVERAAGGRLRISVHPNASLFKAPEIKRAVQGGQAQIGEVLLVNYENENRLFGLDGIPFLASGYGDFLRLYRAQKPALERLLASQNLKLLYAVPWPPQGIYANRTLNSAADMRGLKWRAYSPATARIAELVGAQPVQISAAELQQAMATGSVDSYMSSTSTGWDTRTYEHIRKWYDAQAWSPKNAVIVNLAAFNSLDKATQDAVLTAAAAAEERGWLVSQEKNRVHADQLRSRGMEILQPGEQLKADLRKVGEVMLADWLSKAGPEGKAVIDAFRK